MADITIKTTKLRTVLRPGEGGGGGWNAAEGNMPCADNNANLTNEQKCFGEGKKIGKVKIKVVVVIARK